MHKPVKKRHVPVRVRLFTLPLARMLVLAVVAIAFAVGALVRHVTRVPEPLRVPLPAPTEIEVELEGR
jgi:hypothetical protein